jgi:Ca2+-binding EF-hand superfamily protein
MSRSDFQYCLKRLGERYFLVVDLMYAFFDQDNDGYISFPEFAAGISTLSRGNFEEKVRHVFNGYDQGKGYITANDITAVYSSFISLSMECK